MNWNKVCFCRKVSTRHWCERHGNLALLCPDRAANVQTYRPTKNFLDCSVSCRQSCQWIENAFRSMHQTGEVKTRLFNEQTTKFEGWASSHYSFLLWTVGPWPFSIVACSRAFWCSGAKSSNQDRQEVFHASGRVKGLHLVTVQCDHAIDWERGGRSIAIYRGPEVFQLPCQCTLRCMKLAACAGQWNWACRFERVLKERPRKRSLFRLHSGCSLWQLFLCAPGVT